MQLFFSHTWKYDTENRNNHSRVMQLANYLREKYSWSIWVDEEQLATGNIDTAMAEGVENSDVFIACITNAYCAKVHEGLRTNLRNNDNCAKEWNCALIQGKIMIPVIMESLPIWPRGVVTLHLGRCMYVDATDNLEIAAETLHKMLLAYGLLPSGKIKIQPHPRKLQPISRTVQKMPMVHSWITTRAIPPVRPQGTPPTFCSGFLRRHRYLRNPRPSIHPPICPTSPQKVA